MAQKKKATVKDAVGSVLNQLSSNPDLTRLSLPAVFQYPYSALELGAYRGLRFSQMLVDAAQQKDAVERLSHVVAFAMTSSENEEFSKKPLNPVLGEELTCWTDHADGSRTVFRAEQVSHHPPMSCFFMFNETHNVFFECNVEFGVTFHGNSVTVSTKGYGEIRLGNEVYTISKYIPDLKIDSVVFGSRRQSWRGEWEITCNESGLGAVLNFSEVKKGAGWLGGGAFVNEASGYVYSLNDKAAQKVPLGTFSGLAGEKLVLSHKGSESTILDFKKLTKKEQKIAFVPRNMAPPNDSLRVWQKVTHFILQDDMKKADLAKVKVEENARKLRKQREVTGEAFQPKYFRLDSQKERWVHNEVASSPSMDIQGAHQPSTAEDDTGGHDSATTFMTQTDISESDDRSFYGN